MANRVQKSQNGFTIRFSTRSLGAKYFLLVQFEEKDLIRESADTIEEIKVFLRNCHIRLPYGAIFRTIAGAE